jgi:predicted TIM-barrel fold metal-dependent hydrolase
MVMVKKADIYVQEFTAAYSSLISTGHDERKAFVDTIVIICNRLITEVKEIMLMRKATSDMAFEAVIKEQDKKWQAIVRRLDAMQLPFSAQLDAFQMVWGTFRTQMEK